MLTLVLGNLRADRRRIRVCRRRAVPVSPAARALVEINPEKSHARMVRQASVAFARRFVLSGATGCDLAAIDDPDYVTVVELRKNVRLTAHRRTRGYCHAPHLGTSA